MNSNENSTQSDLLARDLVRGTDTIARKLEDLATHLRRTAEAFKKTGLTGGATGVAADIVNDYMNRVGAQGTFMWTLVRDAAQLDTVRNDEAAAAEKAGDTE